MHINFYLAAQGGGGLNPLNQGGGLNPLKPPPLDPPLSVVGSSAHVYFQFIPSWYTKPFPFFSVEG